jgi:hypothetical protein
VDNSGEWFEAAKTAFMNTYAFEFHGDSLLIAREAMLVTFIENYKEKFGDEPLLKSVQYIADIISWNVWQMDGLKGVVPNSCGHKTEVSVNLFGQTKTNYNFCNGCQNDNMFKHNGTYCIIKDWSANELKSGKPGRILRFIDLMKK